MNAEARPWEDFESVLKRAREAKLSGDSVLAHDFFARATELKSDSAEAWIGRAGSSTNPDDILQSLAHASALQPNDTSLREALDVRVESRVLTADSQDVPSLVRFGQQLATLGLRSQAVQVLRRAQELDRTNEEALTWLAALTDNPDETDSLLKLALAAKPAPRAATAPLGNSAFSESTSGRSPVPSQDPAEGLLHEAELALAVADKKKAFELYSRATEISPRSEAAWVGRARATNDIDEALACLDQALAINPDSIPARESRTLYRVRKLRQDMAGPTASPSRGPIAPARPPIAGYAEFPSEETHRRLILLLVLSILVLILLLVAYYMGGSAR